MASIELRGKSYRIIFRFNGRRFARSLQTKSERVATAALHRLEDNLRRAQLGTLFVPPDTDAAAFLLSDGQLMTRPERRLRQATFNTLGSLCDRYMKSMPEDTIEPTTLDCLKIHIRHFKREFGEQFRLAELNPTALQDYVNQRAKARGRRGRPLSARTIKKEIASMALFRARLVVRLHLIKFYGPFSGGFQTKRVTRGDEHGKEETSQHAKKESHYEASQEVARQSKAA